ncbi:putative reverse transcriptase domain-containing protein [Tanacetum coccineum]
MFGCKSYVFSVGAHDSMVYYDYDLLLLHESGNSNKRDRDGNRIQNRGQGQQENKGRYDQGQHEYRGRQDQSVEHRGRQDRGYDSKRQDFRGQDQRFTGRNGNDRQGQGNYNQRQHRGQSTRDFNQGHASGSAGQRRSTETLPPPPLCTTCGKPHPGVCYKATGGCFTCGSTQHKVKDCPQGKQKQSMPADFARLPPTTGRVYATTRDQAAKTSGTITGILYIDDRTVFVLFDTGATHSIISTTFAKKLNMTPTPLIERVIISTPMKNHMLIDHEYVNCPLRFDDRIRPANLLPIHMFDFDVILGMDWLASHRATIDCYARTVIFSNVRQPEFVYHGSSPLKSVKLISAMKARTLISHGCQGFLASVMDTSLESPNIENLSVVREFADVFPDELPGLPPAREIEFGIELIPGAEPISKAPYRMAPVELKELKEQLQEMWVPTGKLFNYYTGKVDSEPTHGLIVDIPHIHACKQTLGLSAGRHSMEQKQQLIEPNADALYNESWENLEGWPYSSMFKRCLIAADQASVFMEMTSVHISSGLVLHQMTSDHNRSELEIHDHSNEPSSSKLVPKVVPLAFKTATSRQEFGLLGEIISDNEKQFQDNPFKDWCEKLCIRQHFTSVKHPQTSDLVERENRSLGEGIKARLDKRSKN